MAYKVSLADWVHKHAITGGTLNPHAPLDDLEPLRELLGGARVVAIGESAHHVREFYLLRHRLLRFLVEHLGFTIYAFEAPFTEAHVIDDWVQGGPGDVERVAATGAMFGMGRSREMYDHLEWMRAQNRADIRSLRFAGTGLPASGGSPLAALEEIASYLRWADPDALPLLEQSMELVRNYHDTATFKAIFQYTALNQADQDALTAALSRLLSRMETMGAYQRRGQREREHALAMHHLRGVWMLDHFHRDFAGRGIASEHPHALHDAYMAGTVLRLLEEGGPDTRIVVACHNIHIQKTPIARDGLLGPYPLGYYLEEALGDDYLAVAATSSGGRTAQMRPNPEHPLGFEIRDLPLPPLADGSVEAAFTAGASLTIADLRAARLNVHDAGTFQRMRMEGGFMDVPVFDGFDAVALVPETNGTDYVSVHSRSGLAELAQVGSQARSARANPP